MKIKKILAAFLAVFAFTACNNEVVGTLPEPEAEAKADGYLILNITNPVTRTGGDGDSDQATLAESTITKLTVVLTDAAGVISSISTPSIDNLVSERFKVTLGDHYVYALINCPDELTSETDPILKVGGNINPVISAAAAEKVTSGYIDGSFFMVNVSNGNSVNAGVPVTIGEIHSLSSPAKVSIQVDRVVCKIWDVTETVPEMYLATASNNIVDNVDVMGFALLNVNKKFNLVQKWSTVNTGGIDLGTDVLLTPLYPGGEALVAAQYFHNIGEYVTLKKDDDGNITSITDLTVGIDGIFNNDTVYTTENRPTIFSVGDAGELTAGRGETTGVIYKVQAKKSGSNLGTFYKYKGVYYSNLATIDALPAFAGTDLIAIEENPELLRAHSIQVYEDGIMYYTYFIRDPNAAHQYGGKNYYGVFRNSAYKLEIKKISSIGDDVPGGGITSPTEPGGPGNPPIDTKEAYIEVTLTVNPWILNTLDIEF